MARFIEQYGCFVALLFSTMLSLLLVYFVLQAAKAVMCG